MTSNPMTNTTVYEQYTDTEAFMTIEGSINKTLILLTVVILSAFFTWGLAASGFQDKVFIFTVAGAVFGLITLVLMHFRPRNSKPLSLTYALCEGLVLGGISFMYESVYNGIVLQALGGTFASLFSMLMLYKARIIKATRTFKKTLITALLSILIFYIFMFIASFLNLRIVSILSTGTTGFAISVGICVLASLFFILDFDFIEQGAKICAPKYLEWYGACSLLVTIVWLYLEILRLIAMRRNQ